MQIKKLHRILSELIRDGMGDISEMQQEGILCIQCGGYVGDPVDYPRKCEECEEPEHDLPNQGGQ